MLLHHLHGNQIQLAPLGQAKLLVAQILEREDWDENVLDQILHQMDSNTRRPVLDVRSLVGSGPPPTTCATSFPPSIAH